MDNQLDPKKYGKASGMLLAQRFFRNIFPFHDVVLIRDLKEWEKIKDEYGDNVIHRIDYPIGLSKRNIIDSNGYADSIPHLIEAVRKQSKIGVIMLWKSSKEIVPRYLATGGFNISFSIDQKIVIELVGQGFDGSDLTQGRALHERYVIDWNAAKMNKDKNDYVPSLDYRISGQEYVESAKRRQDILINSCHYAVIDVAEALTVNLYIAPPKSALSQLMREVVVPVVKHDLNFQREGLTEFSVQGNLYVRNGELDIDVWEIFDPKLWGDPHK